MNRFEEMSTNNTICRRVAFNYASFTKAQQPSYRAVLSRRKLLYFEFNVRHQMLIRTKIKHTLITLERKTPI